MWEDFLIHAFLGILAVVIKNPEKKARYCHILMQIHDTIGEMYPDGCPQ